VGTERICRGLRAEVEGRKEGVATHLSHSIIDVNVRQLATTYMCIYIYHIFMYICNIYTGFVRKHTHSGKHSMYRHSFIHLVYVMDSRVLAEVDGGKERLAPERSHSMAHVLGAGHVAIHVIQGWI